jgi:hypothetical protein
MLVIEPLPAIGFPVVLTVPAASPVPAVRIVAADAAQLAGRILERTSKRGGTKPGVTTYP